MIKRTLSVIILITILLSVIGCESPARKGRVWQDDFEKLEFDNYQIMIHQIMSQSMEFKGMPFISYVKYQETETRYDRVVYLLAMINDIDNKLVIRDNIAYPFVLHIDKDNGKLTSYFYPTDETDFYLDEFFRHFSRDVWQMIYGDVHEYIEVIDDLYLANLQSAAKYYGVNFKSAFPNEIPQPEEPEQDQIP